MEDNKYYAPRDSKAIVNGRNKPHEAFRHRLDANDVRPRHSSRKAALSLADMASRAIVPYFEEEF